MQENISMEEELPHSWEDEYAVIGSLLIDGDAITRVESFLKPEHFYHDQNRCIYEACHELFMENVPIDQATLRDRLIANDVFDDAGGDSYLSRAVASVPHALNIEIYARQVETLFTLREMADAGLKIAEIATNPSSYRDPGVALRQAEELIYHIGESREDADFIALRDVPSVNEFLDGSSSAGTASEGDIIPTGFESLDDVLGGLHRSDMIVLAARPGFGKSTLALNLALNVAKNGATVGIFSLEMGINQIVHRMAAAHSLIDIQRIRNNDFSLVEENKLIDAYALLGDMKIYVDDTALQTVSAMRGKARRLKMRAGLDLLIVDYMQLINGSSRNREGNRVQEVSEISRHLKAIARDLHVPVLACSQLSRAVEQRRSHEPRLSDLRESGSIEQDADVVMFIHRDDKNISEDEWDRRNPTQPYPRGEVKLIVAKHRHGRTDTKDMSVRDDLGLFSDNPQFEHPHQTGVGHMADSPRADIPQFEPV